MPLETIVPGVRDLIPPQGLVTVQLTNPDTGKVVKEVKAENLIANSFLAQVNGHFRGALDNNDARNQNMPNFSPVAANSDSGFTREYLWAHLGRPGIYPGLFGNYMPWLWASDKNISPDANRTVPPCTTISTGNMTGHVRTDVAHATVAGQLNRGTSTAAESWHRWDQSRLTCEFATTEGNGTYRSIGIGRLGSHYNLNSCIALALASDQTSNLRYTHSQPISRSGDLLGLGSVWMRSASFEDSNHFWLSTTANNLFVFDWETRTLTAGPLSATVTGTNQIGVCIKGSDLWLTRDKQLFRCVKFTGGSLTITNTYNLATPLGAEIIFDITTDGTSLYLLTQTKVFVVNPADGSVTTSWTHGMTNFDAAYCCNIEWDPKMQHLWIHFGTDDDAGYLSGNNSLIEWYWNASDYAYTGTRATNQTVYGYSTAGVALPYRFLMLSSGYRQRPQGFTGMDSQGWTCFQCIYADGTYSQVPVNMCSMIASHALLPSDVVKTSTNGLKIVYDFNFA